MKPFFIILIVVVVIFACIAGYIIFKKKNITPVPLTGKPAGKVAVVFFSQSKVGNTALVAQWIKELVNCDMYSLELKSPYPEPYPETLKVASKDISEGNHPALVSIPNLSDYDIIFLGSPIWYGTYSPPVATLLDTEKFVGKVVAPFCTHGGGGSFYFLDDLKKACPDARVLNELAIRGSNQVERRLGIGVTLRHSKNDVITWLNGLFPLDKTQTQ